MASERRRSPAATAAVRCTAGTTRASRAAVCSPALAEAFGRRFSLCCGRDGCRHRATPPSVRFLGPARVRRGRRDLRERRRAGGRHGERGRARQRACRHAPRVDGCDWWRGPFMTSAPFVDHPRDLSPRPIVGDCPLRFWNDSMATTPRALRNSWLGWRRSRRRVARTDRAS